jgi:hypothetical protein
MSPRDERVIDALRAFTGGLTVTDHDITVAESRLRESFDPPSPHRRRLVLAAAAAAVLVVGFFAVRALDDQEGSAPPADRPSSPAAALRAALQADAYEFGEAEFGSGEQPTAGDMTGFWLLREPYAFPLTIDSRGGWWLGSPTDAAGFGPSTLTGDTWTRQFDDGSGCTRSTDLHGVSQSWRAALAEDGSLRLEQTGGYPNCTPAEDREVWDPVAAGSPVSDYFLAAAEDAPWQPVPRSFGWTGLYVAPATGHLLEATAEEYHFYEPQSQASLTATDQGEIGFDDNAAFGTCAGGTFRGSVEGVQLPGVDGYVGSYDAIRIHPAMDNCDGGLTKDDLWVKVF